MIKAAPATSLKPAKMTSNDSRSVPNQAAQSYWQELFDNPRLSPLEYKYLYPELSSTENDDVKEILTYKLTTELNLVLEADWEGHDAVGLTAFWLKVVSEPKIPQLCQSKLNFVSKIVEQLVVSDVMSYGSKASQNGQLTNNSSSPPAAAAAAMAGSHPDMIENQKPDTQVGRTTPCPHIYASNGAAHQFGTADGAAVFPMQIPDTADVKPDVSGLLPHDAARVAQSLPSFAASLDQPTGLAEVGYLPGDTNQPIAFAALSHTNQSDHSMGSDMTEDESLLYDDNGKPLDTKLVDEELSAQWSLTGGTSDPMFSCKICIYKSPYKSRIKQHMRSVHSSIKPYKCTMCDHSTAIRASLTKHVNAVHNKLKPFTCNLCGYSCNLKSSLDVHMAGVHQKKYKHVCPHCDYGASARNVLDIHIQAVHLKEKPYKCPECPYRSSYPQYIPKHQAAVHDKLKPFACTECDYRSPSKSYLQKHCDAVHNNIKPYSCPHCTYSTSYSQYLSKHISAVHNDEKPHKCPICDFRCAYKQYITKHLELVHSIDKKSASAMLQLNTSDNSQDSMSISEFMPNITMSVSLANQPTTSQQSLTVIPPGIESSIAGVHQQQRTLVKEVDRNEDNLMSQQLVWPDMQ